MTPQVFSTPITELFGIRHPLICGGMMWLANADYVGAVVNAGAMGFITPRSFPTPEDFRAELRRCRRITDGKPFGVNLYVSARPEANDGLATFLDIAIEEKVRFVETAGYSPREFLPRIKDAGIKVIHKHAPPCAECRACRRRCGDDPRRRGGRASWRTARRHHGPRRTGA